jgi:serine/threonine protein kinase
MTPPQTLLAGRYRLLEPIGQGGMGRVWLATDEFLTRQVAVKEVVAPQGLTAAEVRDMGARALREARAAARLSHPNVVTVYDIVVTDTAPWIVMEYLPCRSLFEVVTQDGPLPVVEAARVGLVVLAALRAAHGVGVLHRDVKPSNVLMDEGGRIVLTDFGLATIVGDPSVTRSGMVIGSPSYMAPERARDAEAGAAADLWSLGATVYFAVEGRSPYERTTALATVAALASEEPDPAVRAGRLKPVLAGLLRRDPTARLDAQTLDRMLRAIARNAMVKPGVAKNVDPIGVTKLGPAAIGRGRVAEGDDADARSAGGGPPHPEAPTVTERTTPTPMDLTAPPAPARTALLRVRADELLARRHAYMKALALKLRQFGNDIRMDRRAWAVGIAMAVLLVAAASWAVASPSGSKPPGSSPSSSSSPSSLSSSSSGDAQPSATGPPQSDGGGRTNVALPAGWHMYTDPTGFSVAVNASWQVSRQGTIVYFRESDGGRVLGIDQTSKPIADPVADWRGKETYRVSRGDFPKYQRVRLVAVDYFLKAADWEFIYLVNGASMHVNNRGFIVSSTKAYGMWWSTPDERWNEYYAELDLIQRTFVPAH